MTLILTWTTRGTTIRLQFGRISRFTLGTVKTMTQGYQPDKRVSDRGYV